MTDLDALERLAALKEKGVLSEDEFLSEKRKIISGAEVSGQPSNSEGQPAVPSAPLSKAKRSGPNVKAMIVLIALFFCAAAILMGDIEAATLITTVAAFWIVAIVTGVWIMGIIFRGLNKADDWSQN